MFKKINKEKVKEFFKEHGLEVIYGGTFIVAMGLITGSSIKYDADRTAIYKDMCARMIEVATEKAAKNEPVKVIVTKAIEETCGV